MSDVTALPHLEVSELVELRSLISRIERLVTGPVPRAPVDPDGFPAHVAAGELIESAWGNAVVDTLHTLQPQILRYYAEITAPSGSAGATPLPVPGLTATFTIPAGAAHVVRFETAATITKAGPGTGQVGLSIRLDGTQLVNTWIPHGVNGTNSHHCGRDLSVAAGAHTAEVYLQSEIDAANIAASPTSPAWLRVQDLGT